MMDPRVMLRRRPLLQMRRLLLLPVLLMHQPLLPLLLLLLLLLVLRLRLRLPVLLMHQPLLPLLLLLLVLLLLPLVLLLLPLLPLLLLLLRQFSRAAQSGVEGGVPAAADRGYSHRGRLEDAVGGGVVLFGLLVLTQQSRNNCQEAPTSVLARAAGLAARACG